jgi:hypothetical protein
VDEFEVQVAKVLGRPLVVEPLPVNEELSAPEDMPVAELLEYEFVESATSVEDELRAVENHGVEPPATSDIPSANIAESEIQQNDSSRRKVLIGTTVGLILVVVIAVVALGGGKSDSTSSQIDDSTTTVTENASTGRTDAPTSLGNAQTPETSSQSGAITTTVPQNASSGNASRPTVVTTPIVTTPTVTTPTTTLADSDSRRQMVTDLQISKSHPVFYDWPLNLQQTVTFTARTKNVEQVGALYLMMKFSDGWAPVETLRRVESGIWRGTVGVGTKGVFEFCVRLLDTCDGPKVSVEVLERDQNPPTISDITISTAVISPGETFRVRARIVDESGVREGEVRMGVLPQVANCEAGTLESGDLKDGIWSADCVIMSTQGQGQVQMQVFIRAMDDYRYLVSDTRYPITVQYNP